MERSEQGNSAVIVRLEILDISCCFQCLQTCFGDGLEVRLEDGSLPLPAEGEGDQHHIPRGGELHDGGRTWNRQAAPPEERKIRPGLETRKNELGGGVKGLNASSPGDDLVLQRQQEVVGRELVGSAASRGGAVEGEDD